MTAMVLDIQSPTLSYGWGEKYKVVETQLNELNEHSLLAASNQNKALISLYNVYLENSVPNWDGYNACPVSLKAFEEAQSFLILLEEYLLPLPDISPSVDGGIELEWYIDNMAQFGLCFNGINTITYSGIYGKNAETYGVEPFYGKIPSSIQGYILRLHPEYWDLANIKGNTGQRDYCPLHNVKASSTWRWVD